MIVGIDFSITTPAVCILPDETFSNSRFFFLTDVKKHTDIIHPNLTVELHRPWSDQQERFDHISNSVIQFIEYQTMVISSVTNIYLEDYAMGAKGKVFNIGEATGLLKHKIHQHPHWALHTVPPTVVKKFATGKGNAKKPDMFEALRRDQGTTYLESYIEDWYGGITTKVNSPIADIVDAYWVARYGLDSFLKSLTT